MITRQVARLRSARSDTPMRRARARKPSSWLGLRTFEGWSRVIGEPP
jgi:hypothetical protein